MKTRKNHILSLLIVGALAAIGTSASDTYASSPTLAPSPCPVIPLKTKAKLQHPAVNTPVLLRGTGRATVVGRTINLGNFYLTGRGGKAAIDWAPARIGRCGKFVAHGSGRAKVISPTSAPATHVSFRMTSRGRTDGVRRAIGRYVSVVSSMSGAGLKGKFSH